MDKKNLIIALKSSAKIISDEKKFNKEKIEQMQLIIKSTTNQINYEKCSYHEALKYLKSAIDEIKKLAKEKKSKL